MMSTYGRKSHMSAPDINTKVEADLAQRLDAQKKKFSEIFKTEVATISRAPGRAEILGCHTDYNYGYALAAGIGRSTLCLLSKRDDKKIAVYSTAFPNESIKEFDLETITREEGTVWTNYIKSVIFELQKAGYSIGGANILIDSTVPKSGGVSSSAALELAIAFGMLALYKQEIDRTKVALLCKTAENSDMVRSPCGFLDQGASAFAQQDGMVFLDFLPKGDSPVSRIDVIPAHFPIAASFVIPVDPTLERQLGESGYVVRRKMCEDSLPFWSEVLKKDVKSLRDVTIADFEAHKDELEKKNPEMRKRVEHIVRENQRVLDAVEALKK
jgi:galactokinase